MKKIIAKVILEYEGTEYMVEEEFTGSISLEGIEFIFTEGNYACDCNRRAMINYAYDHILPELPCGDKIKLLSLKVKGKELLNDI